MTPTEPIGLTIIVLQNDDGSRELIYDCPECELGLFRIPITTGVSPTRQLPGRYQCDNPDCNYTVEVQP